MDDDKVEIATTTDKSSKKLKIGEVPKNVFGIHQGFFWMWDMRD